MANLDNQNAVHVWGWKKILLEEEYSSRYMVDIIVIQHIKVFYLLCFESKKKREISPWIYSRVMRSEYRNKFISCFDETTESLYSTVDEI
jgi:hypothetical protein